MSELKIDTRGLYSFKMVPLNRQQKRLAEKEYDKINKIMMPIIYGYLSTCEETMGYDNQEFKKACMTSFVESIPRAEQGNRFIKVNKDFFAKFVPPFSERIQEVDENKYDNKQRIYAYIIIAIIVLLILFSIFG